jgi:hypothetical protein
MGASDGEHHSGKAIATDTVTGAATGAAIGTTVLPGYGTAIGAAAGAIGGFFTGLLTGDEPNDPAPAIAPPTPPDLEDEIARRSQLAQQARLLASGAGDFTSGPLGDTTKAAGGAPRATG